MINPNKVILDGEQSDAIIVAQAAEIRRLRLTDEERAAIECAAESYADNDDDEECARIADTLHGLLERTR